MNNKQTTREELTAENTRLKKELEELKQRHKTLLNSQTEKFSSFYENAPISYQSLNEKGDIINVNPAWTKTLGYKKSDVINHNFSEFLHHDYKRVFKKSFVEFKKTGLINDRRFKMKHKNGHFIDVSFDGRIGYNPDGSFKQTYCVFQDITEQASVDRALNAIATKLSAFSGTKLFTEVCKYLATDLNIDVVFIGELISSQKIEVISGVENGKTLKSFIYELENTPCAKVVNKKLCVYPEKIQQLFPNDKLLVEMGVESYVGIPLISADSETLGIMVLLHRSPIGNAEMCKKVLQLFSEVISNEILQLKTKEALKQSEERYRILTENAPDAIVVVDVDSGKFVDANLNALKLFKLSRKKLLQSGPLLLSPKYQPDGKLSADLINDKIAAVLNGEAPTFEWIHYDSDGNEIPCEIRLVKIPSKNRQLFRGSLINISERKNTAIELERNKKRLQNIIEGTNAGTWEWNIQTGEVELDEKWAQIIGYTLDELRPIDINTWRNNVHPNDLPLAEAILEKLFAKEINYYDVVFRQPHKNGSWVWVNARGKITQWTDDGKPLYMSGTHLDITKRKQIEQRFKIIFESAPDSIFLYNAEGKFIDGNYAAKKLVGYEDAELLGESIFELGIFSENDYQKAAQTIEQNLNGKSTGPEEFTIIRKDKTKVPVEISTYPTVIDNEQVVLGVARDISERVKNQEKLRKNEQLLSLHFDQTPLGVVEWDLDFKITRWNPAAERIFGYSKKEAIGQSAHFFVRESDWANIDNVGRDLLLLTGGTRSRNRNINKSGEVILCDWYNTPLIDQNGTVIGIASLVQDITEQENARVALTESEEKYRLLFERSTDAIFLIDLKTGNFIDANKAAENLTGRSIDELKNSASNQLAEFTKKEQIEVIKKSYKQTNAFEVEYVRPDGDVRNVMINVFPQKDDVVYCIARDITNAKKASQIQQVIYNISNAVGTSDNLRTLIGKIQKELAVIIDTTNFYIALYEKESDTLSLPFFADEKDHFVSMPAGKTLTNYVIKTKKSLLADIDKIRQLENKGVVEQFGSDPEVWLGVPLSIENKIVGALAVQSYTNKNAFNKEDVKMLEFVSTQVSLSIYRKKTEEELVHALEKSKESERLKTAFLQNMSHEIRTPMNGIIGFTQLLKEPGLSIDDQKRFIEIIEKSGNRMLSTINDILDISRIEAGQIKVQISEINVNDQLDYLYTFFKPETDRKDMRLSVVKGVASDSAIIQSDREMIYAILTNLIKNAIKYSNEGLVEFGYVKKESYLEYFVRDTGIGIPEENINSIFERFIQVDQSLSSDYEGAGLGLAITKAYVKMLGGKIWVDSKVGIGSTFYFTIPVIHAPTKNNNKKVAEIESQIIEDRGKLKILIADDEETSRTFLSVALKGICSEFLFAKNGKETVDICKNNSDVDVVLLDVKMPVLDGFKAAEKIRSFNNNVVIIAQTAFALSGDKEKSFSAGCNDYISKPINIPELQSKIWQHMNK